MPLGLVSMLSIPGRPNETGDGCRGLHWRMGRQKRSWRGCGEAGGVEVKLTTWKLGEAHRGDVVPTPAKITCR